MKKVTPLLLLILILFLSWLPVSAQAAEIVDSGICGENLTWTLDNQGILTISGEGDMDDYGYGASFNPEDPAPWHPYANEITSVVVESGVTSIGSFAFGQFMDDNKWPVLHQDYLSIQSVSLPDTVTAIGDYAFWGCSSLTEINMPQNMESVGQSAFSRCESLEHIEFPDTCTWLGGYLFDGCFGLKTVRLPNGLEVINDYLFQGCLSLESIDLPDSVTTIGKYPFSACQSLQNIDIPAGVREIGDFTFSSISREFVNYFTVTFTGNAPTISSFAFYSLNSTVYYPANDPTWDSVINQNYGGFLTWEPLENQDTGIVYGDANNDGEINGKDLILLRQKLAGWDLALTETAADCNADGTINGKDLILLRQKLAGWDVILGPNS